MAPPEPGAWPPPHSTQTDPHTGSRYPGGPTPPPPANNGLIWAVALVTGALAYAGLVTVHLSTETSGSVAYRAGEMLPIAGISAVVIAVIAQGASAKRTWPWWVISLAVLAASALWYTLVEVAPRIRNDARAEVTGQADYRLIAPDRAGEWTRLEGARAKQREQEILASVEEAPQDLRGGVDDVVYGEYRNGVARLAFFGLNTSGELDDELRDSSRDTLHNFMAGNGAENPDSVDPGTLGGSMACTGDARGLPAGMIYCAWADSSTIGQVTVNKPNLETEEAAEITREFRSHATKR